MEPKFDLQIHGDEDGKRGVLSEPSSHSREEILRGTEVRKRDVKLEGQCLLGSRSPSISCSIDANDVLTGKCKTDSMKTLSEVDIFLDLLRGQAAEVKRPECVEESRFVSKTIGLHPTRWKRLPSSRKTLSDNDWGYYKPLHKQRSLPEEVLFLTKRGSANLVYPRNSAKTYRRSMSFPLERDNRAVSSASATSFGSLTTAASSFGASSLYPFFTRQHTSFTAVFRSGELEGFSTARKGQGRSKLFGTIHTSAYEKPGGSLEQFPFRNRSFSSLSADADAGLSGLISQKSNDDRYNVTQVQETSASIQRSYDPRTVAYSGPLAPAECASSDVSGRSSPQKKFPLEVFPAETGESHKWTIIGPCLTKSSCPSCSHSAPGLDSGITRSPARNRLKKPCSLEAHADRTSTETKEASSYVELQRAASSESCLTLKYASASSCSRSTDEEDIAVEKLFEGGERGVRRVRSESCGKVKTAEVAWSKPSSAEAVPSEASQEAEDNCCPNAPLLTCTLPPCSHIPEFELDGGMLAAEARAGLLTDLKLTEVVGNRATGVHQQPAEDEIFESRTLQEVLPTLQSTAHNSHVRTRFSGQLQQALSAIASSDEETIFSAEVTKHSRVGS